MTPQEKAKELVSKYYIFNHIGNTHAKKCALICVNEILEDRKEVDGMRVINDPYWMEVKKEIEKL